SGAFCMRSSAMKGAVRSATASDALVAASPTRPLHTHSVDFPMAVAVVHSIARFASRSILSTKRRLEGATISKSPSAYDKTLARSGRGSACVDPRRDRDAKRPSVTGVCAVISDVRAHGRARPSTGIGDLCLTICGGHRSDRNDWYRAGLV